MIDDVTALRLQLDWGVDEALGNRPIDRFAAPPPPPAAPLVTATTRMPDSVQARTLDSLHAELDGFVACKLRATATHTVRPSGSPTASILVVAEAPGNDDDRSGQAFSGATGAVLDRVLGSIGLHREQTLLTTLVPWRPPGNRPPSEAEVQACLPYVHRLMGIVRPRIAVLLGAGPVAALTGQSGSIRQLRGRWLELQVSSEQLKLASLPFLPLAQWLRDGTTKQQLWSDLMLLRQALTTL